MPDKLKAYKGITVKQRELLLAMPYRRPISTKELIKKTGRANSVILDRLRVLAMAGYVNARTPTQVEMAHGYKGHTFLWTRLISDEDIEKDRVAAETDGA